MPRRNNRRRVRLFRRYVPPCARVVAAPFARVALPLGEGTAADVAQVCHRQSSFPFERGEGEERLSPNFSNAMYSQKRMYVNMVLMCDDKNGNANYLVLSNQRFLTWCNQESNISYHLSCP